MNLPLQARIAKLEQQRDQIVIADEEAVEDFWDQRQQLRALRQSVRGISNSPLKALPFLVPGRIIRVLCEPYHEEEEVLQTIEGLKDGSTEIDNGEDETAWGIVVNFHRVATPKERSEGEDIKSCSISQEKLLECRVPLCLLH